MKNILQFVLFGLFVLFVTPAGSSLIRQVILQNTSGDTVGVTDNKLDVHVADIHDTLISRNAVNFSGTTSNLNANASVGDTALTVVSDVAFAVGNWIDITEGNIEEPNFLQITAKPGGNVLTLDRPIDNAYTTATPAVVEIVDPDMSSANGTLAVPVSYKLQPPANQVWHILRQILTMQDGTAMDTSLFGGAAALANGVVIRKNINGTITTLTHWDSNIDVMENSFDFNFHGKAPAGSYGLVSRFTYNRVAAYVHLDGSTSDYLEVLIQDDLTVLEDMQIMFQGHLQE
jgi:hypothetical protein